MSKGSKDTRTPKLAKRRQAAVWGKLKVFTISEQADKLNKESEHEQDRGLHTGRT